MTAVDLEFDQLNSTVDALRRSISNRMMYGVGKDAVTARPHDWLHAAALAVRDRLVARWMTTTRLQYEQDVKRVYYLSMEFLIGRTFTNALLALGIYEPMREALASLGVDMEALTDMEPDAALGNGGLGRLAACFLDSMATLGIPGFGYGIRYEYGMFRQQIVNGEQVEAPDYWLRAGNPWEFPRSEIRYLVHFGGRTVQRGDHVEWIDTEHVNATAYDTVIPGYATSATNTLRLWSARATDELDLSAFNRGDYRSAVDAKTMSENVSRLLYPDDSTPAGRELRLRQEYFFVSATMQDLIRRYQRTHSTFGRFAEKVAVHLNDTHPVLAIPELMRLLVDVHHVPWDKAWHQIQQMFSYTNHTLMPEALETWDVEMLARLLPRHLEIIFEINAQFLKHVSEQSGHDAEMIRRISLVDEYGQRRVRMAYLAIVASQKVNGVSKLHSQLMTRDIFADFARLYPERFTNVTNGITPRRWLAQASPSLSSLIDAQIGTHWRRDLFELERLRDLRNDSAFVDAFREAKRQNKLRLAQHLAPPHEGLVRPRCAVRSAGEAHSRIQAAAFERAACDRALQPDSRQSGTRLGSAGGDVRGQGGFRVPDGEDHHQADRRCEREGQSRSVDRRSPEGGVRAELRRERGGADHSCCGSVRTDFDGRHRGLGHRQHEAGAQRRADDRHDGRREHRDMRCGGAREHLHLRPYR